jgi:hypothetical protein
VALGTPNVYPGVLSYLGIARELTAGTPVSPVITHPLDQGQFEPEDVPRFLDDKAIRGSMTDLFYKTIGVESATFSFGGPNFLDSHGYFMDNVFGDLSTTSTSIATPATASTVLAVGATQATLAAQVPGAYTVGASLQLGTATTANAPASYSNEVVTISATASSTITFANTPLRFTHNTSTIAGSQVFNVATGPFTHRFAALNSPLGYGGAYGAQPPTHTLTDVTNIVNTFTSASYGTMPTSTYGARQYVSAVLKNIDFSGNAEQLLGVRMGGETWLSSLATSPVSNITTNARPVPNWDTTVVLAGNTISSTGTYAGIGNFTYTPTRGTQVYWIVAGTQTPYIIARGPLTNTGAIDFQPTNSELPLDLMLLNSQAPLSITTTNAGITNAGTAFTLTFTSSQAAITKSKIMRNGILIGYSAQYESVSNSTDVGGSGGLGPCTLTLTNSTPTY